MAVIRDQKFISLMDNESLPIRDLIPGMMALSYPSMKKWHYDGTAWVPGWATGGNTGNVNGSKGEKGDKGDPGEKGDPGQAFIIGGIFDSLADLQAGSVPDGQFGLVAGNLPQTEADYGKLYLRSNNAWTYITDMSVAGAAGIQGPQGPKGEKGDQGPKGEKGDSIAYDDTIIKQELAKKLDSYGPRPTGAMVIEENASNRASVTLRESGLDHDVVMTDGGFYTHKRSDVSKNTGITFDHNNSEMRLRVNGKTSIIMEEGKAPATSKQPTSANSLVRKDYVDDAISKVDIYDDTAIKEAIDKKLDAYDPTPTGLMKLTANGSHKPQYVISDKKTNRDVVMSEAGFYTHDKDDLSSNTGMTFDHNKNQLRFRVDGKTSIIAEAGKAPATPHAPDSANSLVRKDYVDLKIAAISSLSPENAKKLDAVSVDDANGRYTISRNTVHLGAGTAGASVIANAKVGEVAAFGGTGKTQPWFVGFFPGAPTHQDDLALVNYDGGIIFKPKDGSELRIYNEADDSYKTLATLDDITKSASAVVGQDDGNGIGYYPMNADRTDFGKIGKNAFDLSVGDNIMTNKGATGENSFALGFNTRASGYATFVTGWDNEAGGNYGFVAGASNVTSGGISIALGKALDTRGGDVCVTMGECNTVPTGNPYHLQIGNGTTIGHSASAAYNKLKPGDKVFERDVPSDSFRVYKSGLIEAPSMEIADIDGGSKYLLVTKEYLEDKLSGNAPADNIHIKGDFTKGITFEGEEGNGLPTLVWKTDRGHGLKPVTLMWQSGTSHNFGISTGYDDTGNHNVGEFTFQAKTGNLSIKAGVMPIADKDLTPKDYVDIRTTLAVDSFEEMVDQIPDSLAKIDQVCSGLYKVGRVKVASNISKLALPAADCLVKVVAHGADEVVLMCTDGTDIWDYVAFGDTKTSTFDANKWRKRAYA